MPADVVLPTDLDDDVAVGFGRGLPGARRDRGRGYLRLGGAPRVREFAAVRARGSLTAAQKALGLAPRPHGNGAANRCDRASSRASRWAPR